MPTPSAAPVRVLGVDAARGVALAGMMGVHLVPGTGDDGGVTLAHEVFGGRASALFAILAGVGIALASGGPDGPAPDRVGPLRRGVAARAAVVAVVGLTLGAVFPGPVAIILPYYGLLFLLALPMIRWRATALAVAAAVCALVAPVLSHAIRLSTGQVKGPSTAWHDVLLDPLGTGLQLLVTGYYPVLTWSAYLLLGLAVGRCALADRDVAVRLVVVGVALAAAAWAVGRTVVVARGDRLGDDPGTTSFFGTTPTDSWWWLGVQAPHLGSTPDLVHTAGCALAVLGVMLLLVPRAPVATRPLVAAGSMTLTLYTVHVLAVGWGDATGVGEDLPLRVWGLHVALALLLATAWGSPRRRGPLEQVAHAAARAVA